MKQIPQKIYDLAAKLYSIPRSLTGDGVRQTLQIIKELLPNLQIRPPKTLEVLILKGL